MSDDTAGEAARGGWPAAPLALAVAALALLIGGAGLAWLLLRPPGEGSAEVFFARDMAFHHDQAIEMALIIGERSADIELRRFALDLVLTQQAQIGQMQGWLQAWGLPLAGAAPPMSGQGAMAGMDHRSMMGMASQAEVNALRDLPLAEAEVSFLRLMIRHHEGGVLMAQEALAGPLRPEVARMARSIIEAQQSEIGYMRELLTLRGEPLAASLLLLARGAPGAH